MLRLKQGSGCTAWCTSEQAYCHMSLKSFETSLTDMRRVVRISASIQFCRVEIGKHLDIMSLKFHSSDNSRLEIGKHLAVVSVKFHSDC